jgi:hypothetical protein
MDRCNAENPAIFGKIQAQWKSYVNKSEISCIIKTVLRELDTKISAAPAAWLYELWIYEHEPPPILGVTL